MHIEGVHAAQQRPLEREPGAPVLRIADTRQRVEHGVEAGPEAPAPEVRGLNAQAAVPEPELLDQPLNAVVHVLDGFEVLVERRLGRTGEPAPHRALEVPVEEPVVLGDVRQVAATAVDVPRHHGQRVAAEEHPVVVEPEAARR